MADLVDRLVKLGVSVEGHSHDLRKVVVDAEQPLREDLRVLRQRHDGSAMSASLHGRGLAALASRSAVL